MVIRASPQKVAGDWQATAPTFPAWDPSPVSFLLQAWLPPALTIAQLSTHSAQGQCYRKLGHRRTEAVVTFRHVIIAAYLCDRLSFPALCRGSGVCCHHATSGQIVSVYCRLCLPERRHPSLRPVRQLWLP